MENTIILKYCQIQTCILHVHVRTSFQNIISEYFINKENLISGLNSFYLYSKGLLYLPIFNLFFSESFIIP